MSGSMDDLYSLLDQGGWDTSSLGGLDTSGTGSGLGDLFLGSTVSSSAQPNAQTSTGVTGGGGDVTTPYSQGGWTDPGSFTGGASNVGNANALASAGPTGVNPAWTDRGSGALTGTSPTSTNFLDTLKTKLATLGQGLKSNQEAQAQNAPSDPRLQANPQLLSSTHGQGRYSPSQVAQLIAARKLAYGNLPGGSAGLLSG